MYKYVDSKNPDELEYCLGVLGMCHYAEVERGDSGLNYNPDVSKFLNLFDKGLLQLTLAKEGGKIIGYILSILSPCLLTQTNTAKEVGVFVMPHYRGGGHFSKMLDVSKKALKSKGVTNFYIMFKEGYEHNTPKGFKKSETTYVSKLR